MQPAAPTTPPAASKGSTLKVIVGILIVVVPLAACLANADDGAEHELLIRNEADQSIKASVLLDGEFLCELTIRGGDSEFCDTKLEATGAEHEITIGVDYASGKTDFAKARFAERWVTVTVTEFEIAVSQGK